MELLTPLRKNATLDPEATMMLIRAALATAPADVETMWYKLGNSATTKIATPLMPLVVLDASFLVAGTELRTATSSVMTKVLRFAAPVLASLLVVMVELMMVRHVTSLSTTMVLWVDFVPSFVNSVFVAMV